MSEQKSWISPLAKTGYAAKGIVYGTVGVLAALAAFGSGGETTGSSGALQNIQDGPFGNILLILVGAGLAAYSVYRLLGAFVDLEGEGEDGKGLAKRLGYLGSGASYAALAAAAFTGLSSSSGESGTEQELTAKVLGMPGGPWIVVGLGVAIAIAGVNQWIKIGRGTYREKFDLDGAAAAQRPWIERIAKLGLAARGVVFLIIAFFLAKAGLQSDAGEVKGLGGALDTLAAQPYGPWLLGITAIGFVCYGIYCWVITLYGSFRKQVANA